MRYRIYVQEQTPSHIRKYVPTTEETDDREEGLSLLNEIATDNPDFNLILLDYLNGQVLGVRNGKR